MYDETLVLDIPGQIHGALFHRRAEAQGAALRCLVDVDLARFVMAAMDFFAQFHGRRGQRRRCGTGMG